MNKDQSHTVESTFECMTKLVLHLEPGNLKFLIGNLEVGEDGVELPKKDSLFRDLIISLTENTNNPRTRKPEGMKCLEVHITERDRYLPIDSRYNHIHIPTEKMQTLNRILTRTMKHELNIKIEYGSSVGRGHREMKEIIDEFFAQYNLTEEDWSYEAVKRQNLRFRNSRKRPSFLN